MIDLLGHTPMPHAPQSKKPSAINKSKLHEVVGMLTFRQGTDSVKPGSDPFGRSGGLRKQSYQKRLKIRKSQAGKGKACLILVMETQQGAQPLAYRLETIQNTPSRSVV